MKEGNGVRTFLVLGVAAMLLLSFSYTDAQEAPEPSESPEPSANALKVAVGLAGVLIPEFLCYCFPCIVLLPLWGAAWLVSLYSGMGALLGCPPPKVLCGLCNMGFSFCCTSALSASVCIGLMALFIGLYVYEWVVPLLICAIVMLPIPGLRLVVVPLISAALRGCGQFLFPCLGILGPICGMGVGIVCLPFCPKLALDSFRDIGPAVSQATTPIHWLIDHYPIICGLLAQCF